MTVILERHLLSLSNRDFAARAHAAGTESFDDLVVAEILTEHRSTPGNSCGVGCFENEGGFSME